MQKKLEIIMNKTPKNLRRLIEEISSLTGLDVSFVRYTKKGHFIVRAEDKNFVISGTPSCKCAMKKASAIIKRELRHQ